MKGAMENKAAEEPEPVRPMYDPHVYQAPHPDDRGDWYTCMEGQAPDATSKGKAKGKSKGKGRDETHRCGNCGAPDTTIKCMSCGVEHYCSNNCQAVRGEAETRP